MRYFLPWFCLSVSVLLTTGCNPSGSDRDEGGQDSGAQSSLSIKLRTSNVIAKRSLAVESRAYSDAEQSGLPIKCNGFFTPGARAEDGGNPWPDAGERHGGCITPVRVTGNVSTISLGGNYFGGGIRLLGGGGGFGQDFIVGGTVIDLADPLSLGGEDNAQDTDFNQHNTRLSTSFMYLDVTFAVPRAEQNAEYWTYRYVFVPYPLSEEPVYAFREPTPGDVTYYKDPSYDTITECLDEEFVGAAQTADANNANLLGGVSGAKIGDILICRKDSADAACVADDFEWLNTTTGEFSGTRPDINDHVFRLERIANHKITCNPQGQGVHADLGGFSIISPLYRPVQFSADIDGDSKIYEFQYADDSGSIKRGSEMFMYIDLDFTNSLLAYDLEAGTDLTLGEEPDYAEYEALADHELAQMIWFKPLLLWEQSDCEAWRPGSCQNVSTGVKAQLGIELSGNTEHPVYVCEEDSDPNSPECLAVEPPSSTEDLN